MISKEELSALYENELKEKLAGIEGLRKNLMYRFLIATALVIIPIAILLILGDKNSTVNKFIWLFMGAIIAGVAVILLSLRKKREYRTIYKKEVVTQVVHAIDPEWSYSPDDRISEMEYRDSDLFRKSYDRYNGDDRISGVIDKTDFRSSELKTEYRTTTTDSDGNRKDSWHTIFQGLFFHADFNKEFAGRTYITPDFAEKTFGKWGQNLQKIGGKADLVKLENPEFEKLFAVHSTDQTEARYILTPTIMEAMVRLRKEYNREMHISFVGSRVYCAFSFNQDLFEPRILKSGVNYQDIENMYNLFLINAVIIKELNLNTRIWTKE